MVALRLTGNGFAKAGLRSSKLSINSFPSKKTIFVFSKLQKNKKRNGFLRLKVRKSSTQGNFSPAFAKPMLCDVAILRHFYSVRFSFNGIFSQQHFKIQRPICKSQPRKIFRTLKFKIFFGKVLRANFCQRFIVSRSYFSSGI